MSKTSERLEAYQTQMNIYAEQHKIILASDVLDMIEQLQDDLKDDISNVVAELEKYKSTIYSEAGECWEQYVYLDTAQKIVRKGGVE